MVRKPESPVRVESPDLPALEQWERDQLVGTDLELDGVRVDLQPSQPIEAGRVRIVEAELHGVTLAATNARGLKLSDVRLWDCDLSNLDGGEGSITRVEIHHSRLVGLGLAGGSVQDLRVVDSTLGLASFAFSQLRSVVFERVKLTDASFMEAKLDHVEFIDCELAGSDFRNVILDHCAIRGTSLEGVLGVESLKGLTMPWEDVLASAASLAAGLGISIESD